MPLNSTPRAFSQSDYSKLTPYLEYDLTLVKAAAKLADVNTAQGRSTSQAAIRGGVARRMRHSQQMAEIAEAEGISADEYIAGAPGHGMIVEQAADYPDLNGGYASTETLAARIIRVRARSEPT